MEHETHTQETHSAHTAHEPQAHEGHAHEGHTHSAPETHAHATDTARTAHTGHAGHAGHAAPAGWSMAALATLHCLTGCAVGEVLGMVVGTALGWGNLATTILAIVLAFFFGYSLTLRGVLKAGVDLRTAVRVALAADTLSIAVMELIDNGVIALWPDAMDATLRDPLFWGSLLISLAVAFVVTTPVNKWTIGRGKGHAVVHRYHH